MKHLIIIASLVGLANPAAGAADEAYIFASFRGNGEDGLHLAQSRDGLKWEALKRDQSFLKPAVGGKLMRDPCIIQGPDGLFHMVWTTSWTDKGIGYASSKDLITWSEQQFVPVMEHERGAKNCWAPEITWDPDGRQYVIYWATTLPGKFPETAGQAEDQWNHRMYCTTTRDFKTYTPTRLFYEPGFNVIDSTILRDGDSWVMISKDETRNPPAKHLHLARSEKVTGPWRKVSDPFTPKGLWVEGPTALQVGEFWYVYYDCYTKHRYGAMRSRDFKAWEDVSEQLVVPKGMRHGTVVTVSGEVLAGLLRNEPAVPRELPNGGFEKNDERAGTVVPLGWKPRTYAGRADFSVSDHGRGGSRCVRISSANGADAAWQASIAVEPQSRYRLSGWIRTKVLVPGRSRGALLNIHELKAATKAVTGTSDWTEVEKVFDTGDQREITVNALFGGWGTATGSALYDDLKLVRLGDSTSAATWPAPSGNPVIADCIADPSIAEFDGVFYLTATTDDCPREGSGRWHNGPAVVWKSTGWSFTPTAASSRSP